MHLEIAGERALAGNNAQHLIAQRRHVADLDEQMEGVRLRRPFERICEGRTAPCASRTVTLAPAAGICTSTVNMAGTLPRQRIEDQHGNVRPGPGVSMCSAIVLQRLCGNFIRLPAHLVEVFLRVAVDDGDARARGEIVEAVKRDLLPCVGQLVGRIGVAVEPRQRGKLLRIQRPLRPLAQVALLCACVVYTPR